jgi:mannosyl-oligosaccharide alpha-1,2-mannosidase
MLVMNLKAEFKEAHGWVKESLNFDINKDVNLFETTIRVLGGLLSTYHLSKEKLYLDKAVDLAGKLCKDCWSNNLNPLPDRLLTAFDTPSGIPYSDVNLKTRRGHAPKWSPDSSTSEV